jgi:hypothetical protein
VVDQRDTHVHMSLGPADELQQQPQSIDDQIVGRTNKKQDLGK